MKRTFVKLILVLAPCSLFPIAHAKPHWYFTYGVGIVRPQTSGNALIDNNSGASSPFNKDTYTRNEINNPAVLAEVGKRWRVQNKVVKALSLGLQYQHFFATNMGKQIIQYSSPDFINYRYSLDLAVNNILLNAKIELFSWKKLVPFFTIGGGASQLIASGYNENAYQGVTPRVSPGFQSNANYKFIYQIGAGISWALSKSSLVSINYSYQLLTRFETGRGKGSWSSDTLDFGNTYAQGIFLTFTHSFV